MPTFRFLFYYIFLTYSFYKILTLLSIFFFSINFCRFTTGASDGQGNGCFIRKIKTHYGNTLDIVGIDTPSLRVILLHELAALSFSCSSTYKFGFLFSCFFPFFFHLQFLSLYANHLGLPVSIICRIYIIISLIYMFLLTNVLIYDKHS